MFDLTYIWMVMLPGLVLSGIASYLTKSTFHKYARVGAQSGITGAEAAARLLERAGITGVRIEMVQGFLSDHYDPRNRTLRLSPDVYRNPSLSAIGVACHEAGHALQHAKGYAPLAWRSKMVPVTQLTSTLAMPVIIAGMFMQFKPLIGIGAILFAGAALFALVTLPVEYDATARAKKLMVSSGIVTEAEQDDAGKVLNAAFLTYLAGAITAIITLLYYLMRSGLIGGRQ